MSNNKKGKVDVLSDDRADSPAPVRRSTRISLGQTLPVSAPMGIKTRRGSTNSNSEEKITVEANNSPKDKRRTRRASTEEEPKPAPLRSRRSSVSKVIEEETSIPNSPGRRSTRLSSSSPSLDAPARRTRRSSQDSETVEVPARRTTRRSSTGIQESTIEEIVEKAKPITRRRRSSSIDEPEENAKTESARQKTKRLFNEDNHLEPIKEQEQEIKEKIIEEKKQDGIQKLEIIKETADIESEKIIEDLNDVLREKSSPNEVVPENESRQTEKCNTESNSEVVPIISNAPDKVSVVSNESVTENIEEVDEKSCNEKKEKSFTKMLALEKDILEGSTVKEKPPILENSNNDVTNEDNSVEKSIVQQENASKISDSKNISLNESDGKINLAKTTNQETLSPNSDKENTSTNIKRKRLSIKKLEEVSKNKTDEQIGLTVKQISNASICEPMDVDDDEDDIFAAKPSNKSDLITEDGKKSATTEDEVAVPTRDTVNMNCSVEKKDNLLDGSFSHVNSSPDKDSSLLVDVSKKTGKSQPSLALSENKLTSTPNVKEIEFDDCESDTSIKLVDTDDEEMAQISAEKEEGESVATIQRQHSPVSELINTSITSVEVGDEEKSETISSKQEGEHNSELVITPETSNNQVIHASNSELLNASTKIVDRDNEEGTAREETKTATDESSISAPSNQSLIVTEEKDESIIISEKATNQNLIICEEDKSATDQVFSEMSTSQTLIDDSELNESIFDKSFDSTDTNNSLIEKDVKADNSIVKTDFVGEVQKESKDRLVPEVLAVVNSNNETVTDVIVPENNRSINLDASLNHSEEPNKRRSKILSGGKQESDQVVLSDSFTLPEKACNVNIESNQRLSTKISLENSSNLNATAPLEKVNLTDGDCRDEKNIETSNTIESLDSSDISENRESNSINEASKLDSTLKDDGREHQDEADIMKEHALNNSSSIMELNKGETKEKNETVCAETKQDSIRNSPNKRILCEETLNTKESTTSSEPKMHTANATHGSIEKIEDQECNVLKTGKSPSRKIILQKIEIVNSIDVELKSINQSSTQNMGQECENEMDKLLIREKSSSMGSSNRHSLSSNTNKNNKSSENTRNSLPTTKINIAEKSPKSKMSNTSTIEIPVDTIESDEEIHLISSDDEIIAPKTEDAKGCKDKIEEKDNKSCLRKSLELRDSLIEDKSSQKRKSEGSKEKSKKLEISPQETPKKEHKNSKRIQIMQRSGIDVEDDESSSDENHASDGFIDDMAEEEIYDELSEEESDENEIKDIGESVFSSGSDEEISEDDYDLDDPFIDNDELEELLSGEEDFLEEKIQTPKKKKFRKIIRPSTNSSDEEIFHQDQIIKQTTQSSENVEAESIQGEEIEQAIETPQIKINEFEGVIGSILKLTPGESSTPNRNTSGLMNSSHTTESSVIIQETCSVGAAKSQVIINKIQGVVDVFCKSINEPEGDISVNVSLNYKPPSNTNSARSSLNMSFGSKDLNQSIQDSPNESSRLSLNDNQKTNSARNSLNTSLGGKELNQSMRDSPYKSCRLSLNEKQKTNSARNSLNTSLGSKELNQSMQDSPNKSSRLSLNKKQKTNSARNSLNTSLGSKELNQSMQDSSDKSSRLSLNKKQNTNSARNSLNTSLGSKELNQSIKDSSNKSSRLSLNEKQETNSARNSLNMSLESKELNQSINKSSRQSLNGKQRKVSISPRKPSMETVKVEDENEQVYSTNNENTNIEHENETPNKVEEETIAPKKKKRSKKKSKNGKDSSIQKQEVVTEESDLSRQKKSKKENQKKKEETSNTEEVPAFSLENKKNKRDDHSDIKKKSAVCEAREVEIKPEKKSDEKKSKNTTEKKSKRSRDHSEPSIRGKKVRYDESANIGSRVSQPEELKRELKSKNHKESTENKDKKRKHQNDELPASKIRKQDLEQHQIRSTNIKELKPKKSEKRLKDSVEARSSIVRNKTSNENQRSEWEEEDISMKPSASNNTKAGFNLEKYVGRDFKSRMIYDSLRNKREPSNRSKSKKK